jgi:hypothetical protein
MSLGVLDRKLEMKGFLAFFEIPMHQLGSVSGVGIAHSTDLDRDSGGSASQELIRDDARSGRGDPVETLVPGKIFERQERDALYRISGPGASGA